MGEAITRTSGADPGFFKGGGWYIGVAESMGHVPKMFQFENWNLFEKC